MTGVDLIAQQDLDASVSSVIFSELASADYDSFEIIGTCRSDYTGTTTFTHSDALNLRFGVSNSIVTTNGKYEWSDVSAGNTYTTLDGEGVRASSGGSETSYMRVARIPDNYGVTGADALFRGASIRIRLFGLASGQYPTVQSTCSFASGRNPAPDNNSRDGWSMNVVRYMDNDAITDLELKPLNGANFASWNTSTSSGETSFILLGYKGSA